MGDLVLRGIAQQCANLIRKTDMLGRYSKELGNNGYVIGRFGGEEFAILLPETPLDQAVLVAERIRNSIDQMVFKALTENTHTLIHATASFGASSLDAETDIFIDLLTRADQALYTAKQTGRNRVCVFDKHILDTLT